MSSESGDADALIVGITELALSANNMIGIAVLLFVGVQVLLVLGSLYLRPVRTRAQFIKVMLILFAVGGFCSMTIWLLLKVASTD